MLIGVVALVVIVLGAAIGIAVRVGRDSPSTTAGAQAPGPVPGATTTSGSAGTAPTVATRPAASAAPRTPAPGAVPSQRYTGPGRVTVTGPAGWVPDTSAGVSTVADYRAPSSPERLRGPTFRVGIGNPSPNPDFGAEVRSSAGYLQSKYGATILRTTETTFLGVGAADIEYTYFNVDLGVQRHGTERLWSHGSVTMIIQSSDVEANSAAAAAVFQQLVASATVS